MLRIEYEMLTFIHKHSGCSWADVLNAFDPESQCRIADAVLNCFLGQGVIVTSPPGETSPARRIRLSPAAVQLILLYEEEQRKQQEAAVQLEQRLQEQRELEERRIREQHELENKRLQEQRTLEQQRIQEQRELEEKRIQEQRELEEIRLRDQRTLEEARIQAQHKWERHSQLLTALLGLFATVVGALLSFFLTFFAQHL